jgi:subtilisin family serine protease
MKHAVLSRLTLAAACTLAVAACSETPTTSPRAMRVPDASLNVSGSGEAQTYVLIATSSNSLRDGLVEDVERAGGTVTSALDGIGVIIATSADPQFQKKAAAIKGIQHAVADTMVEWAPPVTYIEGETVPEGDVGEESHQIGGHETFRLVQWAPDAVSAPAAWASGAMGAGARVAILDGAIHNTHIDIAPRLDVARSRSFTRARCVAPAPANCNDYNQDLGTFWHGTHVAGIVASPANNIGTVGIAPAATIIGVKVLHGGSGAFSWVINGIYYAATPIAEGGAGADIINMSLGAFFPKAGAGAALLTVALGRATTYAYQQGVTVIAAAGNNAADMDHTANMTFVPAQSPHVISVSATGPMGWATAGFTGSLDRPASYTNYGQSAIALAATGGDFALPGNALCTKPRLPTGTVTTACWVFDMVMAPCRGAPASISTYCWAAGTSMASPTVAGVAALIVGENPDMSPTDVRIRLEKSADDLGKPGNDDYYGAGRVNARRAVE